MRKKKLPYRIIAAITALCITTGLAGCGLADTGSTEEATETSAEEYASESTEETFLQENEDTDFYIAVDASITDSGYIEMEDLMYSEAADVYAISTSVLKALAESLGSTVTVTDINGNRISIAVDGTITSDTGKCATVDDGSMIPASDTETEEETEETGDDAEEETEETSSTSSGSTSSGSTSSGSSSPSSSQTTTTAETTTAETTTAHTHSYSLSEKKAATCTSAGYYKYSCSCGDTYTTTLAALGHSYQLSSTKAATCTSAGTKTYTCTYCGDSYKVETEAALGHSYTSSASDGVVTYTCTRCGASYSEQAD